MSLGCDSLMKQNLFMKKLLTSLPVIAVLALATTGCITYERREVVPARTVVETGPAPVVGRETVITTLPSGYTTRVVRGSRYYYYNNTYYRTYPRGGYVVVTP